MKKIISKTILSIAVVGLFLPMQLQAQDFDAERQTMVDQINKDRASLGLSALQRYREQEACADESAKYDAANGGHASSNKGMCGGNYWQNSLPNWANLQTVVSSGVAAFWNEGPPPAGDPCKYPSKCYFDHGHYLNMTEKDLTKVAVGIYQNPQGRVWLNLNFYR